MQIGRPQLQQGEGRVILSAEVSVDARQPILPNQLWFALNGDNAEVLSLRADAFLVALLPIAMRLNEAIHVSGPVSARLAHGLQAYQDILTTWWPSLFQHVGIDYDIVDSRVADARPEGVGCTFSGGVDSFYTLWRGLPPQQAVDDYRLTHALMINGFDQIQDETGDGVSADMERVYRPILSDWGVTLVMLVSNIKQFRDRVFSKHKLKTSFGSPLVACAHALGCLFGRFSLAAHATYAYADLMPNGAHPILDHHLGTDQLQILHDAAKASRWERIAALADLPAFRAALRVCVREPQFDEHTRGVVNCCECAKCVRTMISLDLLGKLEQFVTFPNQSGLSAYKHPERIAATSDMFLLDNLKLARKVRRNDWAIVLEQALQMRRYARRQ